MSTDQEVQTEVLRRIHYDKRFIEVGEWPDAPEQVEIRTVGAANIEYFGPINLVLSKEAATQLAYALLEQAGAPR